MAGRADGGSAAVRRAGQVLGIVGGGLVGFAGGVIVSVPFYGVLGIPGAVVGAVWAGRRLGVGGEERKARWSALGLAVLGVVATGVGTWALLGDRRIGLGSGAALVGSFVTVLVLLGWTGVPPRPGRWGAYAGAAGAVVLMGVVTYETGGLGLTLAAAPLLGAAAILWHQASSWSIRAPVLVVGIGLNALIGLATFFGRTIFAPPAFNELVGNAARAAATGVPMVLAWWSLEGDDRMRRAAAALALTAPAVWVAGMVQASVALDPAPVLLEAGLVAVPGLFYVAGRVPDDRATGPAPWSLLGFAMASGWLAFAALTLTREMGCSGGNCTDDFVGTSEGVLSLVLSAVAIGITYLARVRRSSEGVRATKERPSRRPSTR